MGRYNVPTSMTGADLEREGAAGRLDIAGPEVTNDPEHWKDRPYARDGYEYLDDSEYPRGEDDAKTLLTRTVATTMRGLPPGVFEPVPGGTEAIDPPVSPEQLRHMRLSGAFGSLPGPGAAAPQPGGMGGGVVPGAGGGVGHRVVGPIGGRARRTGFAGGLRGYVGGLVRRRR